MTRMWFSNKIQLIAALCKEARMRIVILLIIALSMAAPVWALTEDQIPSGPLNDLGNIFSMVKDNLILKNDEYFHLGQYERCIANQRLIMAIDPTDTTVYDDVAWMMQNQLRDDEAEACLKLGIANNRDRYEGYDFLGYFYYTHERPEESAACLEQAIELGAPVIVWHKLAHSYEQAGWFYESLNIWANLQYIEDDPAVPMLQLNRMLSGSPAPDTPGFLSRAREQRLRDAHKYQEEDKK